MHTEPDASPGAGSFPAPQPQQRDNLLLLRAA
jgi:hypothetical protein